MAVIQPTCGTCCLYMGTYQDRGVCCAAPPTIAVVDRYFDNGGRDASAVTWERPAVFAGDPACRFYRTAWVESADASAATTPTRRRLRRLFGRRP